MPNHQPIQLKSISEYHKFRGLPKPEHPLISVVDYTQIKHSPAPVISHFYSIAIKRGVGKLFYGQQEYDFDEGVMYFLSPGQILKRTAPLDKTEKQSGWILLIHPDFLWNTPLAKGIKKYEFFGYSVNEALHLSDKEETTIGNIIKNIQQEYHSNIDPFSQNIIISQIETLLNFAERFYHRQFITRKITNHQILSQLEDLLNAYFEDETIKAKGLPTVKYISERLNISPNYLSSLLKTLTGQTTQHLIHEKLIEKAKEKLSTTELSISEIAYQLGFEHSQSFSKLFKTKTDFTPLEFRQSFN
ncbi:MAG: helix-turn-helix transcriptional regulator [Bacteroidota bacterium]